MTTEILPIDIIDNILSFLRTDIVSLERCAQSHPILSNLSERYIYADVTLHSNSSTTHLRTSEFTQILTKKPDIATHVRSLEIECIGGQRELTSSHLDGVAAILPLLTGLTKFTIMGKDKRDGFPNSHIYGFPWHHIPETFCQAFLHHLRPRDIVIHNVTSFPMELLNDHRNVRVSLSHCNKIRYAYDTISRSNALESDPVPFEHLSIRYCSNTCLEHITACVKLHGLRSLECAGFGNHLQQLFDACSNSLTSLELDFLRWGYYLDTPYIISNGCARLREGLAVRLHLTLAGLRHLTQLQVTVESSDRYWSSYYYSPIPAIADLVSTAPPTLQQVSIKLCFTFLGSNLRRLPDPVVVWSPLVLLAARCSSASISLHIDPVFVIRDSEEQFAPGFFSPLADYKGLTPYVESGAVVISKDYLNE